MSDTFILLLKKTKANFKLYLAYQWETKYVPVKKKQKLKSLKVKW